MNTFLLAETYVGGPITSDSTWTLAGSPYIVTSSVTVYPPTAGVVTLRIEAGVEVRFNPATGLNIGSTAYDTLQGALIAEGTALQPIVFTSNDTIIEPGDWNGIYFRNSTADSTTVLDYCTVEYGGSIYNANLYIYNASFPITNCLITNSSGYGIRARGCSSLLSGNTIRDNGVGFSFTASSLLLDSNTITDNSSYAGEILDFPFPAFTGNTFSNNNPDAIRWSGSIDIATSSTLTDPGIPYDVVSDINVYPLEDGSVTLTITPGVELQFGPARGVNVGSLLYPSLRGALVAQGTALEPIVFTSNASTPAPGDWKGIHFSDSTEDSLSVLDYCWVEYGGQLFNANVYLFTASPKITNSTISYSSGNGIYMFDDAEPDIVGNAIYDNDIGIYCQDASPAIHYNSIESNVSYGVFNSSSSITVDAEYNWWGHNSGPSGVGPGWGDAVSDDVDYQPWLYRLDPIFETDPEFGPILGPYVR
jgi:parallel beta-helix repeat protein